MRNLFVSEVAGNSTDALYLNDPMQQTWPQSTNHELVKKYDCVLCARHKSLPATAERGTWQSTYKPVQQRREVQSVCSSRQTWLNIPFISDQSPLLHTRHVNLYVWGFCFWLPGCALEQRVATNQHWKCMNASVQFEDEISVSAQRHPRTQMSRLMIDTLL